MFDAEQIGVKVLFRNVPANLAFQAGVELVLGHGFEDGALLLAEGSSGSYAMFMVCVATETL
jgi:hypothetical protein